MKNVILIITDTFRYDNLGEASPLGTRTPSLDRFASERATSVTRFFTGSFPTIPHRTDLATGRLGWPHYGWQPIGASSANHIGKLLGGAGYATQLICDCPHLFRSGFQGGFDAAFQHRGQEGDRFLLHLNDAIREVQPHAKTRMKPLFRGSPLADVHRWLNRYWENEADTFPARTAATAVRWLEENHRAGPFFLWVDFFDPHEPWDPPEYMVRRYDPAYSGTPMIHPNYGRSDAYTAAELANLRAHYAAESELVDRWIGRVLEKVDDLGLWEESVVVVTSDHGHSVGEHGRTGKSNLCDDDGRFWPIYPEVGQVPFLVAGGGVRGGRRLDVTAQPIDILPTVVELAGAAIEPKEPLEGRSFAGALRSGGGEHREFAVSGQFVGVESGPLSETAPRCVTPFVVSGRWGYAPVGAAGERELYDLEADPAAETNVAGDHADAASELHGMLVEHLSSHRMGERRLSLWRDLGAG